MRKFVWTTAALFAVAAPLALVRARADDDKKPDGKSSGSDEKIQVRIERLDDDTGANQDRRAKVRVLRGDGKPIEVGESDVFVILDDDEKAALKGAKTTKGQKETYLGLAVEPIPAVLAAQMPDVFGKDQGVLVAEVHPDSPAAKAGLKAHDVIMSYDDQKLFSAEQLTKLVRADKPGRDVTIAIVRAGKSEKVKVTTGEHEARETPTRDMFKLFGGGEGPQVDVLGELPGILRELPGDDAAPKKRPGLKGELKRDPKDKAPLPDKPAPGAKAGAGAKASGTGIASKSTSMSMSMQTLDADRIRLGVEFKGEDGDAKKWSGEGTRDQLRKELESAKDLPESVRKQLIRSLDATGGKGLRFDFPDGAGGIVIDGDVVANLPDFIGSEFNIEKLMENLQQNLDPELRDLIKNSIRSIDKLKKKPATDPNDPATKKPVIEE